VRHSGWYPRRRGLLEHLERGEVSLLDIAIHDVLSLWADRQTGICWASAEKINALAPSEFSYKSVQRSLAKLERIGWIKRWMTKGKRGNYPVLVCRYYVRDEFMTWFSTSGEKTSDWRDVKFDAVHDPSFNRPSAVPSGVRELGGELSLAVSGVQEGRLENEQVSLLTDFTDKLPCSMKTEDPWAYSGVVFKHLPKEFRTKEFDAAVRMEFAEFRTRMKHDDGDCYCSPLDFINNVIDFIGEYPPAFEAQRARWEKFEDDLSHRKFQIERERIAEKRRASGKTAR
jgi:hypothetical protein